jgi:hypothetical protein
MKRILLLTVLSLSFKAHSGISGSDVSKIFSSSCSSQGSFTQRALADTDSLITIIEGIKDDENCKSIASSVASLRGIRETLSSIGSSNELNQEFERLTAEENEIINLVLSSTDTTVIAQLESLLRDVQIRKAQLNAEIQGSTGFQLSSEAALYTYLVESSESLINSVNSNSKCLNKYPQAISSLAALGSGISAITYSYNPALALGFSAVTNIFGNTVEYFRKRPYRRLIGRVSNATTELEGYKCALESLSTTWCINDEAEKIVELKAKLLANNTNIVESSERAITINDKEVPIFLGWLKAVKAGAAPSSSSEGERQSRVLFREATVESKERTGLGIIQEEEPRFNSVPTESKFDTLKLVVLKLSGKRCTTSVGSSSQGENPLNEVFGGDTSRASYYLLGIDQDVRNTSGTIVDFCNFRPSDVPGYTPDYQILKERYSQWIESARSIVAEERTRIIQPDPLAVLTLSYDPSGNEYGLAPLDAATRIYNFLNKNIEESFLEENRGFRLIYNDTIRRLKGIIDSIENAILMQTTDDIALVLQEISKLAGLDNGIVLFQNRLEMIIRNSIQNYYRTQIGSNNSVALQLLAANSFLDTLKGIKGSDNLTLILSDINNAKKITLSNMSGLLDVFGKNIKKVLKKNQEEIQATNDPDIRDIYQRNTSHFCLLLSSMPAWPEDVPKSYCLGSSIPAAITGGPSSPKITGSYLNSPFSKRSCGFRKFIQKSKVFQTWGITFQ